MNWDTFITSSPYVLSILAIAGATASTIASVVAATRLIRNGMAIEQIHLDVNSRLTQLLELSSIKPCRGVNLKVNTDEWNRRKHPEQHT